jgi:hypothetical protein
MRAEKEDKEINDPLSACVELVSSFCFVCVCWFVCLFLGLGLFHIIRQLLLLQLYAVIRLPRPTHLLLLDRPAFLDLRLLFGLALFFFPFSFLEGTDFDAPLMNT